MGPRRAVWQSERASLVEAHEAELQRTKAMHRDDLQKVQDRVREVLSKKNAQIESLKSEVHELRCGAAMPGTSDRARRKGFVACVGRSDRPSERARRARIARMEGVLMRHAELTDA